MCNVGFMTSLVTCRHIIIGIDFSFFHYNYVKGQPESKWLCCNDILHCDAVACANKKHNILNRVCGITFDIKNDTIQ